MNPLSKQARAQRKCKACLESVSIFGEQGIALTPERAAHIASLAQQHLGRQQHDAQQQQLQQQQQQMSEQQQPGEQQPPWPPLWPPPAEQQAHGQASAQRVTPQQQQTQQQHQPWTPLWPPAAQQQQQQGQQQQPWAPLWPPPQQQQPGQQQQQDKQQPQQQPQPELHIKAVNASEELMARLTAAGLKHLVKHTATCPTTKTSSTTSSGDSSANTSSGRSRSFSAIASRIKSFSAGSSGSATGTTASPAQSGPNTAAAAGAAADPTNSTTTAEAGSSSKDGAGSSIPLEHAPAVLEAAALPDGCNLVVIEVSVSAAGLSESEAVVAGLALLGCVPAVFVAAAPCRALAAAAASPAGRLWGACDSYAALEQRLAGDLRRVASLRQQLLGEISGLLAPFKAINQVQHFAKRAPLALVPFGVHTINALGLVRLAKSVLRVTGMGDSKQAKRAVAGQAAVSGAKVTAINSLSDVYQLIVQGSIISEAMSAAAGAASVAAAGAAAADTVTLLDAFTLGTVCVFTGIVSAVGAAMCRPALVDGMGRVVAAQQLAVAVRPQLCVLAAAPAADDGGGCDDDGDGNAASGGGGGDQMAKESCATKKES